MNIISTPLYFGSGTETLFGWLHQPPSESRSDAGLVICKPFGYEAVCAHSSLRAFADACAASGVPVLRFDYAGTGDSSGADSTSDQIAQWCGDIGAAIETLRRSCGVERVGLLGVRLGALLASLVAEDNDQVDALIAVAPVVSGRRYLRELRAFEAANTQEEMRPSVIREVAGEPAANSQDGTLEVAGFSLSAASVERLGRTALPGSVGPGAERSGAARPGEARPSEARPDAFAALYHEVRGDAYYAKKDYKDAGAEYMAALGAEGPDRASAGRASAGRDDTALLQLKIADLGAKP